MAIPFLQPEDDESARQQHAATQSGIGPTSPGMSAGGSGASGIGGGGVPNVLLPPPPPSPLVVSGSIPIPGSPALLGVAPPPSGTSTAVQTPLLGPTGTLMHGDQLVQLFYEALYRYSRGDTPSTPISQSPQSSSCSPFTTGYYNTPPAGGQVFFPQTPSGVPPRTPNGLPMTGGRGGGGARIFFGQPTPSPSGSSSHSSQHSANSPDAASLTTTPASCSSAGPIFHSFPSSFSGSPTEGSNSSSTTTTTSQLLSGGASSWPDDGSESSESDSSQPSSSSSSEAAAVGAGSPQPTAIGCSSHCLGLGHLHQHRLHHHHQPLDVGGGGGGAGTSGFIPPHLDFMAGREQLQEFTGKIPQRKKKSKAGKAKKAGFLEQTLAVWPTLAVTATLIALGCGLLAAR